MLVSARTRVKRKPNRAAYDRSTIERILDEGVVCHVGFLVDAQPYVIPTLYARRDRMLYLHGSHMSRMLRTLASDVAVCVTVSILDGLVLARSAFHHAVNYRSVMILGRAREVVDEAEKEAALWALVEHIVPGRSVETRMPDAVELKATMVLRLPIEEASAKIRIGPPNDKTEDYERRVWAGELPLCLWALPPTPDPRLEPDDPLPDSVMHIHRCPGLDKRRSGDATTRGGSHGDPDR